ncbi:phosphonate C-P lyase system protein PhnL [Vineibacter terrae]|uniref:Phosphonate C-P lyase system protein PhnL n=1 Tax=Vineibacter terrae TaxID=2586908 RepID=A0A5C8PT27_9HYPH|nr:phosphonate C-P lyase system protein PhnL [Vineibacter terrae]TXL79543.1 phosphonate C-P lyase system protein PhnL [Vineibacter terrae]
MRADEPALRIRSLRKTFTLHLRGGVRIDALRGVDLDLFPAESVVLRGPSGAGKSTLMRCIYGNYAADGGSIRVAHDGTSVELVGAAPRQVHDLRRRTLGYVSQFLRVIPRVPAIDIVAEPLLARGIAAADARRRAAALLERLNIPSRLFDLPPATFSGGEQQRVNIAHVFIARYPILLLDEPTASLDDANRGVVVELIQEARRDGAAILAILHDAAAREALATRIFDLAPRLAEVA